jgi:hypothetical protein
VVAFAGQDLHLLAHLRRFPWMIKSSLPPPPGFAWRNVRFIPLLDRPLRTVQGKQADLRSDIEPYPLQMTKASVDIQTTAIREVDLTRRIPTIAHRQDRWPHER